MRLLLILLLTLFFHSVKAQIKKSSSSFPASWEGHWKGTIGWEQAGRKDIRNFDMQLIIKPVKDSAMHYTWNLIYGKPSEDNRPYLLKPVDTAKGHWVIDEINGIVLDQYLIGNNFTGVFSIEKSTIVNTFTLAGDELLVEFISYNNATPSRTGKGNEDSPFVDSYKVISYQKGRLKRISNPE